MRRQSVRAYLTAIRADYLRASKREQGQILKEAGRATGYHRKSLVRLLRRPAGAGPAGRRRPRRYGTAVVAALRRAWEASDRLCSKRLAPFLPELVASLEHHGELAVTAEVRAALLRLSPATIDRLLRPYRTAEPRRPFSQSRAPLHPRPALQEERPGLRRAEDLDRGPSDRRLCALQLQGRLCPARARL